MLIPFFSGHPFCRVSLAEQERQPINTRTRDIAKTWLDNEHKV